MRKAQSGILTLMIIVLLLIALSLYLINQNRAKTQNFDIEEDTLNLYLKQAAFTLVNIDTRYKGNGKSCDTTSLILSSSQPLKRCEEPSGEQKRVIASKILNSYYRYLQNVDKGLDYEIYVYHQKPVYANGIPITYSAGNQKISTFKGEKIAAIQPLVSGSLGINNEKIRITAIKKKIDIHNTGST